MGTDKFDNIFIGTLISSISKSIEQPITVLALLSTLFYIIFYLINPYLALIFYL